MSSSNNAPPDDTVINIENDATIPNQNQSTVSQENGQESQTANNPSVKGIMVLAFFVSMIVLSFFFGTYNIFPILFQFFLSSFFMAGYGQDSGKYYFLIPVMLTLAWNTFYATICVLFYISFYAGGKEFFLNKALYFCWAEKAEIFEKIGDNWVTFVLHLIFTVIEILFDIDMFYDVKVGFAKLQKKYEEEMRRVYGEESVQSYRESLQQNGLAILANENPQNPYAQFLAQIPPPPTYESNSILLLPQTPQNGTPPPTYSMQEREQLDLDSLHHSQQSVNNHLSATTQTTANDTTFSSPKNNISNESTAMSPSSILN